MVCSIEVIILCAIATEYEANLRVMSNVVVKNDHVVGQINGVKCLLYRTGIGALAAERAVLILVPKYKPKIVIYSGIAGSRNSKILIGNVVVSGFVCDKNSIYFSPDNTLGSYTAVQLRKGDEFLDRVIIPGYKRLCKKAEKHGAIIGVIGSSSFYTANQQWVDTLNHVYHVDAGENEGIGFAYAAISLKIPFLIIRGISDSVYQPTESNDALGAKKASETLSKIVSKSSLSPKKRTTLKDLSPISYIKSNGYTTIVSEASMTPPVLL